MNSYPELSLPLRPLVRIPLPEGNTAPLITAPLITSHLSSWFRVGKSQNEVADMLQALPGIESYDVEDEVDRAWQRFVSLMLRKR